MFKRFKPVYDVRWRDLVYPKEVYRSVWHRLLGIQSPSCVYRMRMGFARERAVEQYVHACFSRIKLRVNKRQATRKEYKALRHYERMSRRLTNADPV